jgi:hypothetical protein
MNWLDKWIARKVRQAWDDASSPKQFHNIVGSKTAELVSRDRMDSDPDLNFRMFRAENGYVMEVRYNDRRTDRTTTNLHLISDEEDLGQSIAHIITVESLKVQ